MSLFNKWWDAANSNDRAQMAELLDDEFIFVRQNTGEEWNKDDFLDYRLTGFRDKTVCENRRLICENDRVIISHSILNGPAGSNAVMPVSLVKSGRFIRAEAGSTLLPAKLI